jgi:hypothetical protein
MAAFVYSKTYTSLLKNILDGEHKEYSQCNGQASNN